VLYGGTVLYGRTPSFQTDRTCTVLYGVLRYGIVITVKKAEVRRILTSLVILHKEIHANFGGFSLAERDKLTSIPSCLPACRAHLLIKPYSHIELHRKGMQPQVRYVTSIFRCSFVALFKFKDVTCEQKTLLALYMVQV